VTVKKMPIEVALPLEAINKVALQEMSIPHGIQTSCCVL
jgi:hypothetical protein